MDALRRAILRELKGEVEKARRSLEAMEVKSGTGNEKQGADEVEVVVRREEACKTLLGRWRRIGEVVEWALRVLP